jgi:hypothetical protein
MGSSELFLTLHQPFQAQSLWKHSQWAFLPANINITSVGLNQGAHLARWTPLEAHLKPFKYCSILALLGRPKSFLQL